MIKINRAGKHAIDIRFDIKGARELCEAFRLTLTGEEAAIALSEAAQINSKKVKELRLAQVNDEESLHYAQSGLMLKLDSESIENILDKLRACIEEGKDFFPAECCEVRFGKINLTFYAFLEKALELTRKTD
ncbi:hypothetical protein SAMN04487969_102159 [Paenibacillus algorifonticola]|uniref:Uncharacterized protein n=1 Tax=Paenibacillus algorifonticola TaxID=684063 RepID=A0A1I1ZY04_9BACL|nr:hypothetical protein [Paenibacillus algorifonticola]SFE36545.1 hypothetical protein SAMN04487969_102159 [Paenibacillus algorifonticola]